ncbi:helix-turn-helix domain-containing protein [Pantoea sp.]|uniref:helix-turn-helix domain-containing protein n=1 Tax=Pantoea sp. TaxID=69393 RepID=UPI0028A1E468|nr:helix-turn-helix domain-containing protein [Pantoea sp.]
MEETKYNESVIDTLTLWINDNLENRLSIDDIAQKAGYSKWYLQKLFVKYHHESLARYIRKKKLVACIKALKSTPVPIITLAVKFHFESQQSFTRSFKGITGCTPYQCRKRRLSQATMQQFRSDSDPCTVCKREYPQLNRRAGKKRGGKGV